MRCHMIGRVCLLSAISSTMGIYPAGGFGTCAGKKGTDKPEVAFSLHHEPDQCLDKSASVRGNRFVATWIIL